jgi:glycosyltransferase involved in cell wall biosynthesis
MRVLWFTNDPLPAVHQRSGRVAHGTGGWMPSLLEHLVKVPGIQVEVATSHQGSPDDQFNADGVEYFVMGQRKYQPFFRYRRRDLVRCVDLVRERTPDLIHIHGTERYFGLLPARRMISTPCVISLQGLLIPYADSFFGGLSPIDVWRSERFIEVATRRGLLWRYRDYREAARREREILAGAKIVLGRTDWDRAHAWSVNPRAEYLHVGEVLRKDFQQAHWDVNQCERHSIIFTNAGDPRRGTETLLRALMIVRQEFPGAKLRLAGGLGTRYGYDRFLQRMIVDNNLSDSVEYLGRLDAGAMAKELSRCHVFAIASYIENSPNSLCEAMQVGMPCVASYVGGIPNLVDAGRSGLLFPAGDAALLADSILRIFRDDDFAAQIGRVARLEASQRHDPRRVLSQLLSAYGKASGALQPQAEAQLA